MSFLHPRPGGSKSSGLWRLLVFSVAASFCAPAIRIAPPTQMQAWVVYFDADRGLAEVRDHGSLFDRISLFAYELAPDGTPRPAPLLQQIVPRFLRLSEEHGFAPWVTVVNDVRFSGDSAILKDPSIVHELLIDPARRAAHVRALAHEVEQDGFSGLHLDYEQVAESDSTEFRAFVGELRSELERRELGLEVVVEPSRGPLPEPNTISVSVMGYDLFGPHSGPGPRATPEFVSSLRRRLGSDADSTAGLAMALGGFAWEPGGAVRPLDWARAEQLAVESTSRQRGELSGVPHARLDDGTELWFEDPESLLSKWDAAFRSGFRRLLLWRLGGNDERLFDMLRDLKRGSALR